MSNISLSPNVLGTIKIKAGTEYKIMLRNYAPGPFKATPYKQRFCYLDTEEFRNKTGIKFKDLWICG